MILFIELHSLFRFSLQDCGTNVETHGTEADGCADNVIDEMEGVAAL